MHSNDHSIDKKSIMRDLFEILRFPTITRDKNACKAFVQYLSTKLKKLGVKTKVFKIGNSNPFIYGEIGKGPKTLLIYDHYDVMPVDPLSLWKTTPFEPAIRNGKIYARGVADNKGHIALRLQALEHVLKKHNELPLKIKFIIEGEEEIGSPNLHKLSEKYDHLWKDADLCLWESGEVTENNRPLITLGMKGIVYLYLSCKLGEKDLHSGYASLVDSATWRLIQALSTMRDAQGNVTIKGITDLVTPPVKEEVEVMENEDWNPYKLLKSLGRDHFLTSSNNKLNVLKRHYFGITCNICGIWSGSTNDKDTKTVLPNEAHAKIDLRLVPNIDSEVVVGFIRKHLDSRGFSDITVKEMISEPVGKSDIRNPNLTKAISIIEKSYAKKTVIHPITKGSGPIYYIASKYHIPVVQLGASYPGSSIHAPNENVRVRDYFQGLKATIDLFTKL